MSDQVEVEIRNVDLVLNKLQNIGPSKARKIKDIIEAKAFEVERLAKQKVNGQVLRRRTGNLSRSISTQNVSADDSEVRYRVWTNVPYARVHEYGFEGVVNVKAHYRKSKSPAKAIRKSSPAISGRKSGHSVIGSLIKGAIKKLTGKIGAAIRKLISRRGTTRVSKKASPKIVSKFLVRAHSRRVRLPERSFLRSSFSEIAPSVNEAIAKAMEGVD